MLLFQWQDHTQKSMKKLITSTGNNNEVDFNEPENEKKFLFRIHSGGTVTDQFVNQLKHIDVPIQSILTLCKLKTVVPSLKLTINKLLKSCVVYS